MEYLKGADLFSGFLRGVWRDCIIILSAIYNTTCANSHPNRYFRFVMISSCNLFVQFFKFPTYEESHREISISDWGIFWIDNMNNSVESKLVL